MSANSMRAVEGKVLRACTMMLLSIIEDDGCFTFGAAVSCCIQFELSLSFVSQIRSDARLSLIKPIINVKHGSGS